MSLQRVGLCCILGSRLVSAHFLWLKERGLSEAVVTFDEKAGVPGPAFFLPMVQDKISMSLVNASGTVKLQLAAQNTSGGNAELTTAIDSAPPFSLKLASTFGIFNEDPAKPTALLKYYSNADLVTTPNDWFKVQDWNMQEGLEVTIRDPWMKRPTAEHGLRLGDPGDECKAGGGPEQDGEACVVAVVRFNGQLLEGNVSLTTFVSNGTKLRSTTSTQGVTILKVPLDASLAFTEIFASANYRESSAGTYGGKNYSFVDHWATTYARLARAKEVLV